jgi:two-component system chemotaxis sensor kinase CheA
MSIDLSQFEAAFFEESREAVDTMEAALLELDARGADAEAINTVFRAAHSIKGGAGMFGFADITGFTHTLETLLDELRSERMPLTPRVSNALLRSVDVLREMLGATQQSQPAASAESAALHDEFVSIIAGTHEASPTPAAAPAPVSTAGRNARWSIHFRALPDLLTRGNDPVRLFADLAGLGALEVRADLRALPPLARLDPEVCHLAWNLVLDTALPRETIDLIFEWVEGDCEYTIERLPEVASDDAPAPLAAIAPATPPAPSLRPVAVIGDPGAPAKAAGNADSGSIRVNIEKIDELLNAVGEIVITQSMLLQLANRLEGTDSERLRSGLSQLEANVRELQESVMRVRMLPVSFVFSRFPRLVRDLAQRLGKQIRLQVSGEQTELDKTVLEKIGDPLVHLVRNSIDHGIESPDARIAAGKPAEGTVRLHAFHKGGSITIEVCDDGAGLDRERILAKAVARGLVDAREALTDEQVHELIFLPGFSTAEAATDLSGRGVGMDVVRRNIHELGGTVELHSEPGKGTRFVVNLPLTLAIVDGQLAAVGDQTYIVPIVSIIESLQVRAGATSALGGESEVFLFRGEYLPIVRLHELFGVEPRSAALHEGLVMVVEGDGRRIGLYVDALLGQQQVVIKSLESNYGRIDGIGGATILGEGSVALILDVPGLIRLAATAAWPRRVA